MSVEEQMKVYIATNKDNKDALMHYGVKGMRWGKRGNGRFKWPWEKEDPSAGYKPESSRNSRRELAKTIGKMYKTSPTTYGGIRGSSQFYKEHGPSGMRRRVDGNTNMTIALSQYPAKRREHDEKKEQQRRTKYQRRHGRR